MTLRNTAARLALWTAIFVSASATVPANGAYQPQQQSATAPMSGRRTKNRPAAHVIVYDTVRVTVTDTIRITYTPPPPVDTLRTGLTPVQMDSLVAEWVVQQQALCDERFFAPYSEPAAGEELMPEDSLYRSRLQELVSPVHLPYNNIVRRNIDRYLNPRGNMLGRIIAASRYYFPIIERELIAAGLPVELRTLAIVESNLSSLAVSRMGAAGLWQFMPQTGKNLGLEINSLVDERCDPQASTRAACRFLKDLYRIYGDWTLALAAYNCGPGKVNRALARAGAECRTFWDIYDLLPAETREYVPRFIAASYAYAYHRLHGIEPAAEPGYIATETVDADRVMHLGQVASVLGIPMETLRALNPQYRADIIPAARKSYPLTLPAGRSSEFELRREEIYARDSLWLGDYMNPANLEHRRAEGVGYVYTVRKGDTLSAIAARNRVTVKELMRWNKLGSTNLRIGQKLRIERPKPRS